MQHSYCLILIHINAPAACQLTKILFQLLLFTVLSELYIHRLASQILISHFGLLPISITVIKFAKSKVEQMRNLNTSFIWVLMLALVSQNLVLNPVMSISFEDQKHYYASPNPPTGSTPTDPHRSPPHGTSPSPSHGKGGSCNHTPSTPSTPSGGGGGYNPSPPSTGTGGGTPPTPTPAPITPTIPSVSPPTPLIPDPNTPIGGTCTFWRTHPGLIWSLLGWWGTVGGVFGVVATPAMETRLTLPQALSNNRGDGIGALYREGTAAFLNSMVNKKFPFSTQEVKVSFARTVASTKAAAAQAELFKQANEGRLRPRT